MLHISEIGWGSRPDSLKQINPSDKIEWVIFFSTLKNLLRNYLYVNQKQIIAFVLVIFFSLIRFRPYQKQLIIKVLLKLKVSR